MNLENKPAEAEIIKAELRIGKQKVSIQARFSDDLVQADELVPLLQNLTNKMVEIEVDELESKGKQVSCRSGCGACCSQLVPISMPEAIYLLNLIDAIPEQRQTVIHSCFSDQVETLRNQGLLAEVAEVTNVGDREARREIGIRYFNLHMPCPFLEDQSCSIHPYRPLSCREFLVVSDPKNCTAPDHSNIESVVIPRRISPLLYTLDDVVGEGQKQVIPLILLLEWADKLRRQELPRFSAASFLKAFLTRLASGR